MPETGYAAIVLAGGAGRRLGGAGKPLLRVGGQAMLHRVLAAVAGARRRIVVGPASLAPQLPPDAALTSEDPPGGGPVAAVAAGLRLIPATTHLVAVLAADQPFVSAGAVAALVRAAGTASASTVGSPRAGGPGPAGGVAAGAVAAGAVAAGATYVDGQGHRQLGCCVWHADALRARLAEVGPPAGVALHRLADRLTLAELTWSDTAGPPPWYDCDTEEDLARAEEWAHGDVG